MKRFRALIVIMFLSSCASLNMFTAKDKVNEAVLPIEGVELKRNKGFKGGYNPKVVLAISDTLVLKNPQTYFVNGDSIIVFKDPALSVKYRAIELNKVVYVQQISADGEGVLISTVGDIEQGRGKEQIIGWASRGVVKNLKKEFNHIDGEDSTYHINTVIPSPLIDKKDNSLLNIDGDTIHYNQAQYVKTQLKRVNVLFVLEQSNKTKELFPQILNTLQNLAPTFIKDTAFVCGYGGVLNLEDSITTFPLNREYHHFVNSVKTINLTSSSKNSNNKWGTLLHGLALLEREKGATNLIIILGEYGGLQEEAPQEIIERLNRLNCRVIGIQLFAQNSNIHNNFVLQVTNMIEEYSKYRLQNKRKITFFANELPSKNSFKERSVNSFILDYPLSSASQGGVIFPVSGEKLLFGDIVPLVDSVFTQIKMENKITAKRIDNAFSIMGYQKDKFTTAFLEMCGLPKSYTPSSDFKEMFKGRELVWYKDTSICVLPSQMIVNTTFISEELSRIKLLLSQLYSCSISAKGAFRTKNEMCNYIYNVYKKELKAYKKYLARCAKQIDYSKPYPIPFNEMLNKYRDINNIPIGVAHFKIFGTPTPFHEINSKSISALKTLSTQELQGLIRYFKETLSLLSL